MRVVDVRFSLSVRRALTVATYFDRDTADEAEIRHLVTALYERADWNWAALAVSR